MEFSSVERGLLLVELLLLSPLLISCEHKVLVKDNLDTSLFPRDFPCFLCLSGKISPPSSPPAALIFHQHIHLFTSQTHIVCKQFDHGLRKKCLFLQSEGAYLIDGKGLNNWDVFTHDPGYSSSKSSRFLVILFDYKNFLCQVVVNQN